MRSTTVRGNQAELGARSFLEKQGCQVLVSNFRSKTGEIDLIVIDRATLVFVEVRYRAENSRGSGAESVTHTKQRRIISTAEYFLVTHPQYRLWPCRFDVISMDAKINWIRRAFTLDA